VFYEAAVFAFFDSDGDGVGDFTGLGAKLDYLSWLGADCLWLLPFYESPMRDGGYDVADFRNVHKPYGTIDDVARLLSEAHRRGIRVIADLPINHTSDRHRWFVEARQPGSSTRDRYVWTDDPSKWGEARVIFSDTHDSNWSWDPAAGAYYWHRFFDHQPDLNYDHPDVGAELIDVARFWLDMGLDGLRLDAAPYLYERDGTDCENLPETHAWLKKLRAVVDEEYGDRVLLCEANQRPEDVVAYFGDGDECHMAFHFPLMPRPFMAVKRGDASAVAEIIEATPAVPEGAQWGVFLRNHDELTLEMVSEEERAYMYEQYAPEPAMRKNLGIRRRLAPLLDGDRRRIELMHAVLLSLPGSPFLYYGDEIGMGDAHTLDDRDGVRAPMQWDSSPGAGFSTADPSDYYLPLVAAPGYGPEAVNVEAQQADGGSLLNRIREALALRRERPLFGAGGFELVPTGHRALLAYLRSDGASRVAVIANFSGEPVEAEVGLDGARWRPALTSACRLEGRRAEAGPYGYGWFEPPT